MFQIHKERNNIYWLSFLIPQPSIVQSIAKVIKGSMIYDDYTVIRFKAQNVERYDRKKLDYKESLRFIWSIATQIKYLILERHECFFTFNPQNLLKIDGPFVYIDDVMEIDETDNMTITSFIKKDDEFISPELREIVKFPYCTHYKTIYYSFGKLLQFVSNHQFDDIECFNTDIIKRSIQFTG